MQYIKRLDKILVLIFLLGVFLRFYKLDQIPSGFYVDEAMIGYNAYSLLQTARDEYGKSWPVFLKSYSVFSPPLYSYITVLFIKLFDLNIFSVRFLSALSGSLSILLIAKFTQNLFKNKFLSHTSALVLAISPWSIFFSRGAFEVNFSVFILLLALVFMKNIYLSTALLAINTYAYHSQRLISLFVLLILFLLNIKTKRKIIFSLIIFIIILLPQIFLLNTPAFGSRAGGLFYFDIATTPIKFLREFFAQYFNYFSPNNLFIRGDQDPQRAIPELSIHYSYLVIPYLLGLVVLIKNLNHKSYKLVFSLFLLSPIVPALTRDPFSTLRNLSSIIPITIIISLGINYIYKHTNKHLFIIISVFALIISSLFLWRSYFVLFPYEREKVWSYGYEELANIIKNNPNQKYLVENSRLKPPYILLAFYMKLDPKVLQSWNQQYLENYYTDLEWNSEYKLANFETRNINWEIDIYKEQILVGDEFAVSEGQAKEHFLEKVFEIKTRSEEIVFVGYKTNPKEKLKSLEE